MNNKQAAKKRSPANSTQNINPPVTTKSGKQEDVNLTINQIQIRSAARTKKDIQTFIDSVISATSVYFPNFVKLFDLIETHVSTDGHLTGIVNKRILSVLNKRVEYQGKDGKKKDAFDTLTTSMSFRDVETKIMETLFWNRSGMEFVPGETFAFVEVPRKHINLKYRTITIEQTQQDGVSFDSLPLVWIIGNPSDLGLYYKCAPYTIYKRGNLADWANYIEIFGIPMRVIRYDANDEQTKIELKQILEESGSAMALMIPKQADFTPVDGKQSNGNGDLQMRFDETLNKELSTIILGNTETTTQSAHSGGSNALGKVHGQQQDEIHKSDIIYTEAMLNEPKFIEILKSYGYPVEDGGKFVITQELDMAFLAQLIALWVQLPEDLPISDDDWYETFHIPKPTNYDQLKKEIQDKQKALKQANDIQQNPTNKPENKPENDNKPKPKPLAYGRISKMRNLYNAFSSFFDPAR